MKIIQYEFLSCEINHGTEEDPNIEQIFLNKEIKCSDDVFEANYAIAQKEAVGGEITVEDLPDPVTEPTEDEKRDAQIFYTAMMTDTLLEEV